MPLGFLGGVCLFLLRKLNIPDSVRAPSNDMDSYMKNHNIPQILAAKTLVCP